MPNFDIVIVYVLWIVFRSTISINEGKLCPTVLTGLMPHVLDDVNQSLAAELREYERMDLMGQLTVQGNLPCLTCGEGDACKMSGLKMIYGPNAKTSDYPY